MLNAYNHIKKIKFILFSLMVLLTLKTISFAQPKEILYAGTYSDRGSKGIYVYQFNRADEKLTELQTVTEGKSPNYLEVHPNKKYLYAVYNEGLQKVDQNGRVMSFKIDPASGFLTKLNEVSSNGRGPAHVSVDPKGRFVYVSNYGEGTFSVYRIAPDGSLGEVTDTIRHTGKSSDTSRQKAPHVHSIIPSDDGKFIYVSDLGIDKVMIYQVNSKTGKVTPAKMPFGSNTPGSGPRHFAIHPNGKFAFSAEEMSSTVSSFTRDPSTGALTSLSRMSMLPADFKEVNSAADIHFSPDGKFLYASNRGHQSLVIYAIDANTGKMTLVGNEDTHGKHPRNFCMDSKGLYVFIANRDTDNITIFKRDSATGKLTYTGEASTPAVVCIKQLFLN
ncbi:MAG: lactonase family protein [Chitinophagaceae bacterium]